MHLAAAVLKRIHNILNSYKCYTIEIIAMHNITEPENYLGSTERLARLNYMYLHNY